METFENDTLLIERECCGELLPPTSVCNVCGTDHNTGQTKETSDAVKKREEIIMKRALNIERIRADRKQKESLQKNFTDVPQKKVGGQSSRKPRKGVARNPKPPEWGWLRFNTT